MAGVGHRVQLTANLVTNHQILKNWYLKLWLNKYYMVLDKLKELVTQIIQRLQTHSCKILLDAYQILIFKTVQGRVRTAFRIRKFSISALLAILHWIGVKGTPIAGKIIKKYIKVSRLARKRISLKEVFLLSFYNMFLLISIHLAAAFLSKQIHIRKTYDFSFL